MHLAYYHVDAFTSEVFGGNPAGVCPLDHWLPDDILQFIAAENNLSETAFFTRDLNAFQLRWFTPKVEVDLCGHATLAAAHVLFHQLRYGEPIISFESLSGMLTASHRDHELIELDFPARPATQCNPPEQLMKALGHRPRQVLKARDYVAVYDSQAEVASLSPNMALLAELDCLGIVATAPGEDSDFVSRFFAPKAGVPEDPVTGSSHCSLIPFWAERLKKNQLFARQISSRGGELFCRLLGERVGIAGRAVIYSHGTLNIDRIA